MSAVIIAIALISGYIFANLSLSARYKFKRAEGWDAYFYLATWGVAFTTVAWVICTYFNMRGYFRLIHDICVSSGFFEHADFQRVIPIAFTDKAEAITEKALFDNVKYAFFGLTSMTIAGVLGGLSYLIHLCCPIFRMQRLSKAVSHNPVESMVIQAYISQMPLMFSTKSRKFYVGIVHCPKFERAKVTHIRLLPLLSGYRANSTLKARVTTNYKNFYIESGISGNVSGGQVTMDDFEVVLPVEEITSLSFIDLITFEQFREIEKNERSARKTN